MSLSVSTPVQIAITLLISAMLVSGCSNSGSSQSSTESELANSDGEASVDNPSPGQSTTQDDPIRPDQVRVNFDITVPEYVSDALQVRLVWGEQEITANWVVDESWSVSADFMTDTENLLMVTFADNNGDVTLGVFEQEFKTGTEASELYEITADQFDTNRWDDDGDGISNINEPNAETNPHTGEIPAVDNDLLLSLFPDRLMLFGHSIESIPDPDFYIENTLASWDYQIIDDQLVNDRYEPLLSHQLVWQRYVDLTLPEHRKILKVVKFIYDTNATLSMSVFTTNATKVPGGAHVELHIQERIVSEFHSTYQSDGGYLTRHTSTLIHEHAHILEAAHVIAFSEEYDVPTYALRGSIGRVLWSSPLRAYYRTFWEGEKHDAWRELASEPNAQSLMLQKFPGEFVSWYAATTPAEDFAESFMFFVDLDSMPVRGEFDGAEKILWFWEQPEYVTIRDYARAAF